MCSCSAQNPSCRDQPHLPAAGLKKDVVQEWFCSWRQKGKRPISECSQGEDVEAASSPFSRGLRLFLWHRGPISVPQAMAALMFTTLYSPVPSPLCLSLLWATHAFKLSCLPVPGTQVGAEVRGDAREREPGFRALGIQFISLRKALETKGWGKEFWGNWLEGR